MESFRFLEPLEEDKLHTARILPIEERPLKRLRDKLLGPKTPFQEYLTRRAQPSSTEADPDTITPSSTAITEEENQRFHTNVQNFRTSIAHEFSVFDSNLSRVQLLRAANEAERHRYATEKLEISDKASDVRSDISNLRIQLEIAQQTLATRKTYDVLADKITKNASLKPRDEQHVNIEKLKSEIEELERESVELTQTWSDRRSQLENVVNEAQRLRRQIRNEKEPGEADAEDEDDEMDDSERNRSNIGTPRPDDDGGATPLPGARSGANTPLPGETAGTPRPTDGGFLEVPEAMRARGDDLEKADDMDTT